MENHNNNLNEEKEKTSMFIYPFSKMQKIPLLYYILSFLVLFFRIFVLKSDNLTGSTYRIGFIEFAFGLGWIYYLVNAIGILTVISPLLKFLRGLGTKVISIINLVISGLLLFKTIPDAINPVGSIVSIIGNGELGIGFWLILGLHLIAVLLFWFSFIRKMSKRKQAKQNKVEPEIETENTYDQY